MSAHSIPVLGVDGRPLTPTTPARARRLVRAGQAHGFFNKLDRYCIRLLVATRAQTPLCTLGVDPGAKHDGMAVVCGRENVIAVALDLPDKDTLVHKMAQRRTLRRARRFRKTRRRPRRFDNRGRAHSWIAPSQLALVQSRLKVQGVLLACYPITVVGLEDVAFDHARHRWGKHFSTVEIGKARVRAFLEGRGCTVIRFAGYETKELRVVLGYKKSSAKGARCFAAHCSDALALACALHHTETPVPPGPFLLVDDTYRPVRRRLHATQPAKGGARAPYSRGRVLGLRKGLVIGTATGKTGRLCGVYKGGYRYHDQAGKRQVAKALAWVSAHLYVRTTVRA